MHVGQVRAAVGQGAAQDQDPRGGRGLGLLDARGQPSLPARAGDGEVPGSRPGRALPDVIDVVGGEGHQLEGEVPVAHLRVGQDDRFLAEVQPGQGVQGVVVRAAAVPVGGVHEARGVPEVIDRGIRDDLRVAGLGHPVVADLGVVDVREAVDERLHSGGVGVLGLPVDAAGEQRRDGLPQHRRGHLEFPGPAGQVTGMTHGTQRPPASRRRLGRDRHQIARQAQRRAGHLFRSLSCVPGTLCNARHARLRLSPPAAAGIA